MNQIKTFEITATSPATASTAAAATVIRGLQHFDEVRVDAILTGATGGTLDVYLQREVIKADGTAIWVDWLHFAQLAAGAAAARYSAAPGGLTTVTAVGHGTSPALAAGTFVGGHPGNAVRVLFVAGASTSAGASQTVLLTGLGVVS